MVRVPPLVSSFRKFWPRYLAEHRKLRTRTLHLVGTGAGLVLAAIVLGVGYWWLLPAALVPGYGLVWLSHWHMVRNRPATFRHPIWSLRADLAFWTAGRRKVEYGRFGID